MPPRRPSSGSSGPGSTGSRTSAGGCTGRPRGSAWTASRARRHIEARRPRFEPDPAARAEVAERFLAACRTGDLAGLLSTLAPDVVLRSDGGGKVSAARRPIHGAERVVRFLDGVARQATEELVLVSRTLNGTPGLLVTTTDGAIVAAFVLDIADDAIQSIEAIRNPDKLAHLAAPQAPGDPAAT